MNYTGHNFLRSHSALNGTHAFRISVLDIARASVTVGYGGGFAPFNPLWLLPFHAAHFTMPFFLLSPIADPSFLRPFLSLVPRSIRRYVAERLAMAVTKVWADRYADIPWLAEVEFLEKLGIIQFDPTSKERPDLVGQDLTQAWHVFEAKGRPNASSISADLAKAKRQAGRVQSISGSRPGLSVGCVLHSIGRDLHLTLDDPAPSNDNGVNATIRQDQFYYYYYQSLRDVLAVGDTRSRSYAGRSFDTIKLSAGPLRVSLGLLDSFRTGITEGVDLLRKEPLKIIDDGINSVGSDGTALFID